MNKKGDFPSTLYVVIIIVVLGITLFFVSHLTDSLYSGFDSYFDNSPVYNDSEAHTFVNDIQGIEQSIWDYAFLGMAIGLMITLMLTAYATRISIAFFWLYAIAGLIIEVAGVALSNMWQSMSASAEFATTLARFPIMNTLLGTYYPLFVLAIVLISMILLFGKSPDEGGIR